MLALVCQDFCSLVYYLGYEKILGLRGDRTKKQSLEARADAFSRLKKLFKMTFMRTEAYFALAPSKTWIIVEEEF